MQDISKDIASNLPKPGGPVALYWVQDSNEVIWIFGFWRIQIRKGLMSYTLRRGIEMETIRLVQNANIKSSEKLAVEEEQIFERNLSVHGILCIIKLSKDTVNEISRKVVVVQKSISSS